MNWIWIKKFFPQDDEESVVQSRRAFLGSALGAGAGLALGIVAPPVKIFLPPQKVFLPNAYPRTQEWRPTTHSGNALSFVSPLPYLINQNGLLRSF